MQKKSKQLIKIIIAVLIISLNGTVQQSAFGATSKKSYESTKIKAFNEIRKAANMGDAKNLKLVYDISNSFPADLRKFYVDQAEYTSKLVATFLPAGEVMNIYLYTEKDATKIANHEILRRDSESFQRWFDEWKQGQSQEHNLGLAAWYTQSSAGWQGHAGLIAYSGANAKSLRRYAIQVLPHEYFHVIQDYYLNKERGFSWPSYDLYAKYSPPTFREGSANTISFALASKTAKDYLSLYQYFIAEKKNQREVKFFNEMSTNSKVVAALKIMENNNNREDVHEASYAIGQLLYEWVIAKYGFEGYRRIIENQIKVDSFAKNIQLSLGITVEELYRGAAPHLVAAFKYGF
jgi:hypothetical protein